LKNTVLICGLVLSIIIVGGLWFWIWVNRGNDSIIWLFAKTVVAPLVLACVLLFYEFFGTQPLARDENLTYVIPYLEDRRIVDLARLTFPSVDRSVVEAANSWQKAVSSKSVAEYSLTDSAFFLDLAEAGTLIWMHYNIGDHWDVDRARFVGLYGGGMGQIRYRRDTEKNPVRLNVSKIASLIPQNKCYQAYARERQTIDLDETVSALVLPSSSKIWFERNPTTRTIIVGNPRIEFSIRFTSLFGENEGPETVVVKHIRETLKKPAVRSQVMELSIHYRTKRLLRWSNTTIKQEAWATDLINRFKYDFDWEVIRKAIERDYDQHPEKSAEQEVHAP
jgi:hypothetical protein